MMMMIYKYVPEDDRFEYIYDGAGAALAYDASYLKRRVGELDYAYYLAKEAAPIDPALFANFICHLHGFNCRWVWQGKFTPPAPRRRKVSPNQLKLL